MFCTNCGRKLQDGTVFCPECGTKVKAVQSTQPQAAPAWQPEPKAAAPAAQSAPVYTAPAAQVKDLLSKRAGIWPSVCGVMGILALMFCLSGYAVMPLFGNIHMAFPTVNALVFVLMAVVFFVHTRKIPWVTIFPFLIYIVNLIVQSRYILSEFFSFYRNMGALYLLQIITTLLPIIIFIFYVLITLIRPRNAALRVLLLVFTLIEMFLMIVSLFASIINGFGMELYWSLYMILMRLSLVFFYIGYLVAGMSVRRD